MHLLGCLFIFHAWVVSLKYTSVQVCLLAFANIHKQTLRCTDSRSYANAFTNTWVWKKCHHLYNWQRSHSLDTIGSWFMMLKISLEWRNLSTQTMAIHSNADQCYAKSRQCMIQKLKTMTPQIIQRPQAASAVILPFLVPLVGIILIAIPVLLTISVGSISWPITWLPTC